MDESTIQTIQTIDGDVALPGAYDHPHASEAARLIAEQGMILRAQVGSGVHGTSIAGQDDRDEMGICLEPPEFDRDRPGSRGDRCRVHDG